MDSKGRTDKDIWLALQMIEDDLLDPSLPDDTVEDELRELGLDPEMLAKIGTEFVGVLREKERLSWQTKALERRAQLEARVSAAKIASDMDRNAILARLNELRASSAKLGTAIMLAARKRKPEESNDNELRDLWEEMEMLRAMEDGEKE